ncbi:UNVERIFIED_CONTAM: Bifunctional riboflavin kinase/FMN phosphatase [Sesamum radiatum]|uniref:riboflavin kinase n=1 Tax=Sesamum radiatum TaxID=300843 RepID=A0AAW2QHV3_SESRA
MEKSFSFIMGGDQVTSLKPSPVIYPEAAKGVNVDPSIRLVIEDSLCFPFSLKSLCNHGCPTADVIITTANLLNCCRRDRRYITNRTLVHWWSCHQRFWPWLKGAPESPQGFSAILLEHPSGVYFGWAGLATRGVYKMKKSIGCNPYFNNTEKTIVSYAP